MDRDERVVGHDDDRRPKIGVGLSEEAEDLDGCLAVELAGRLVGQDDRRIVGQGEGDRHALLLAARQPVRAVVRPILKAHPIE